MAISSVLCPKAVLVLPEFPSPLCHAHGRARLHSVNWKTNPRDSDSVLFFVICTDMGVDLTL
ncbi:hypothetical protein EK904_000013 [Melospiza melodia maxima]|nr:hypothetical protein EK904_000013 [Melospiza melodia maxima]